MIVAREPEERMVEANGDAGEATNIRLTPLSFIVLGLLEYSGESTSYELKQLAGRVVNPFWVVQHAQLYAEPERLAQAGYLTRRQESSGRRRRYYALTERGRGALEGWRAVPSRGYMELRDPGLLQLFFGADPGPLARAQLEVHEAKLGEYLQALKCGIEGPPGIRRVWEAGIGHEHEWIRFWSAIANEAMAPPTSSHGSNPAATTSRDLAPPSSTP